MATGCCVYTRAVVARREARSFPKDPCFDYLRCTHCGHVVADIRSARRANGMPLAECASRMGGKCLASRSCTGVYRIESKDAIIAALAAMVDELDVLVR